MRGIGLALGFVAVLGLATTAAADENRGLYLGGGVGMWNVDLNENSVNGALLPSGYEDSSTAWRALVGYDFNRWLAIQGDYLDYTRTQQHTTQLNSRDLFVSGDGYEASVKLTLPLGEHFEVYGRAGWQWYNFDLKLQYVKGGSDSSDAAMYAGGIGFRFSPSFTINAEYEDVDVDNADVYVATLNAVYKFGRKEHAVPVAAAAPVAAAPVAAAKCPDADRDGVCDAADQCPNTPAGTRVGPAGCDCDYVLRTHFAFDSAELTADDKAELDRLAGVLVNPKLGFVGGTVTGYTDNVGKPDYNVDLSKRRAQSVADYLRAKGVKLGDRFSVIGMGEANPIADNKTEEGRAQNRRVTIRRTDCPK